jgi:hypothetical protein
VRSHSSSRAEKIRKLRAIAGFDRPASEYRWIHSASNGSQRMTARTFLLLSTVIVLPACSVVSAAGTAVGTAASVAGAAVRTSASVAGSVASTAASAAGSAVRGAGDAAASDKTAPAEAAKH